MSNVLTIPPIVGASSDLSPAHRNLKLLSLLLVVLFALFIASQLLWVFGAALVSFVFSDHALMGPAGFDVSMGTPPNLPGMVLYSTMPLFTRSVGMFVIVLTRLPFVLAFWELCGLFRLYAKGIVFARENAMHLKRVGIWLLSYPVAQIAGNIIFRSAGSTDKAWFHMELIYALVVGLIVFVIARVMELGHDIEQERDSFL